MTILGITCQRDDGPFLGEWIAHHLACGFDRMLVLSHECCDGSDALLDAFAGDPRVQHVTFTPKGRKSVQWQALKLIADHSWYTSADWALFFDCDEFLCSIDGAVPDMIERCRTEQGAFDALALPWRLFGSSGHTERTAGLTPARFTKAAPRDLHFPLGHLFKTLHRPGAFRRPGVHRPRLKPSKPARWLGPDGAPLADSFAAQDGAITLYGLTKAAPRVWLNHYSLRSVEEFMVKRARGLPNHQTREIGLTYWAERNWNAVEETAILPMLAATQTELDKLLALPGATQAMQVCRDWHAARYQALTQDIDALRLAFRLSLLTGSTPPSAAAGAAFYMQQSELLSKATA